MSIRVGSRKKPLFTYLLSQYKKFPLLPFPCDHVTYHYQTLLRNDSETYGFLNLVLFKKIMWICLSMVMAVYSRYFFYFADLKYKIMQHIYRIFFVVVYSIVKIASVATCIRLNTNTAIMFSKLKSKNWFNPTLKVSMYLTTMTRTLMLYYNSTFHIDCVL